MVKPVAIRVAVQPPAPPGKPAAIRRIGLGPQCPKCKGNDTRVLETRAHPTVVRARMRHCFCHACNERFKTSNP